MRHGSLFSGIGGFDLAAQWMGWENVFQVEIDPFCQKVLEKNFKNVKRYGDIKEFNGTEYRGTIDVLSGGFPCQPFSSAGKRKGKEDDRFIWPEMLRVVREVKPSFIVGENVAGIIGMAIEQVLTEMEAEGYHTETFIIPACAVNAPHRRDRVWIIAYHKSQGLQSGIVEGRTEKAVTWTSNDSSVFTNTNSELCGHGHNAAVDTVRATKTKIEDGRQPISNSEQWDAEPALDRVADGVPNRVDRIKGLGNAIVPQVAFEIFKAIEQCHNS
jgi:DNA (cytosine-5)-methyltransferase 1